MQELLAVAIDILNVHRGNYLPQLPENDVLGLLFDMGRIESQKPNGRVLHDRRFDADGDGEDAGDVDANILNRQRVAQRHFDLDGLQTEIGIVLDDGEHEPAAAVDAQRRLAAADFAEDHQHAVAGTPLVALGHEEDDSEKSHQGHEHGEREIGNSFLVVRNIRCQQHEAKHGCALQEVVRRLQPRAPLR